MSPWGALAAMPVWVAVRHRIRRGCQRTGRSADMIVRLVLGKRGTWVLAAAWMASGWGAVAASEPAKLQVAASIFPIADVVQQIGRERVTVTTLLRPGQSPHGYEPRPEQAEGIARARLLVMVGLGLDEWARRAAEAGGGGRIEILELGRLLDQIQAAATRPAEGNAEEHGASEHEPHQHGHGSVDPHIWLDPVLMMDMVPHVAEALGRIDPPGRDEYRRNAETLRGELRALDEEYRRVLSGAKHKEFVTFHAAFGRLAARYGLKQEAVVGAEAEEGQFGPGQLEAVVRFIKQHGVKVVFAEPQFPPERLKAIAEQTGAAVGQLDPLGNPLVKGRDGYLPMMRYNLSQLAQALER
jgi:zinc transport system substrate-binding protein